MIHARMDAYNCLEPDLPDLKITQKWLVLKQQHQPECNFSTLLPKNLHFQNDTIFANSYFFHFKQNFDMSEPYDF